MPTINKQVCECCGQSINKREIAIFSSLISALFSVWRECEKKGVYTFTRKEAKKMFTNENITARFGDLILFGGILFKPEGVKGVYAFNIERAKSFFMGELAIPTHALKDPLKETLEFSDYRKINEFKGLKDFCTENGEYIVRYKEERKIKVGIPEQSKLL